MPLAATLGLLLLLLSTPLSAQPDSGPYGSPQRSYDFGDSSSAFLVEQAWKALEVRDHPAVVAYVRLCVELYEAKALEEQKSLREPVPPSDLDRVHSYAAMNNVGTAYFILGQLQERRGNVESAIAAYKVVVEKLPFAQCWDVNNHWFWKPADAAKARLRALENSR